MPARENGDGTTVLRVVPSALPAVKQNDENPVNFPAEVSANVSANWLDQRGLDLAGLLLGTNAVRIPGHARLNITYVKANAYLRWRWTNRETSRREVWHIGAFAPKREGTRRIPDEQRKQYEQQRADGGKRTRKRRGKANRGHHRA